MNGCNIIMLTSCKGGVGKTTVCANLAASLALMGKRTLMLDCDFSMRCLDIISGLEDSVLYDLSDVVFSGQDVKKAVIKDSRFENLYFLAAPYRCSEVITPEEFKNLIEKLIEEFNLEYLLIDTHGGVSAEVSLAASVCNYALIVSTHNVASLRAAEQTDLMLSEMGVENTRLIINCFEYDLVREGNLPGVISMIDKTGVQLFGIVPFSPEIIIAQSRGLLVCQYNSGNMKAAFNNIAKRIEGKTVPLLRGFKHINRNIVRKA